MYIFIKTVAVLLVIAGIIAVIAGISEGVNVVFAGGLFSAIGFTLFILNKKYRK